MAWGIPLTVLPPLKKICYLPENIIDSVIVARANANNDGMAE
jgi:hypothetical protein